MIVVVTAGSDNDVVYWEQERSAAVFNIPVRGTFAGFRTPAVTLDSAMPRSPIDTVLLSGSYAHGIYDLRASRDGATVRRLVQASPSLLWSFLLPVPTYAFGRHAFIGNMLWLVVVWLTIGYWGGRAMRRSSAMPWFISAALTIAVGLALVPVLLDLHVAHWSEWLAAAIAALAGWRASLEGKQDANRERDVAQEAIRR
jgi:hypothetical protein